MKEAGKTRKRWKEGRRRRRENPMKGKVQRWDKEEGKEKLEKEENIRQVRRRMKRERKQVDKKRKEGG